MEKGKVVGGYTPGLQGDPVEHGHGPVDRHPLCGPRVPGKHLVPSSSTTPVGRLGARGRKIYLASEHTNYYEKFGFHTIGPDACAWGEPTQMFEADTLPPEGWQAA